jgi:hypothetical protein
MHETGGMIDAASLINHMKLFFIHYHCLIQFMIIIIIAVQNQCILADTLHKVP